MCIVVYDVRPTREGGREQTAFDLERAAVAAHPDVLFAVADSDGSTPLSRGASKLERTKRQTSDVARMLLALASMGARHVVLLEDDW